MNEKLSWFWFTSLLEINRKTQGKILSAVLHPEELRKLNEETAKSFLNKRQYRLFLETRDESYICKKYEELKSRKQTILYGKNPIIRSGLNRFMTIRSGFLEKAGRENQGWSSQW